MTLFFIIFICFFFSSQFVIFFHRYFFLFIWIFFFIFFSTSFGVFFAHAIFFRTRNYRAKISAMFLAWHFVWMLVCQWVFLKYIACFGLFSSIKNRCSFGWLVEFMVVLDLSSFACQSIRNWILAVLCFRFQSKCPSIKREHIIKEKNCSLAMKSVTETNGQLYIKMPSIRRSIHR